MLKTIEQLIKCKTVYPNYEEITNCLHYIKAFFSDSGLYINEYECKGDKSIVISNSSDKNLDIIFCGHIDVVPANDDLFKLRISEGRIYARGAADMKSQVAVMMHLMLEATKSHKKIALMLTSDEERGGFNGTKYLLDERQYSCKIAIVPDGGADFNLVTEEKGVLQIKLAYIGKEAHSAYLWKGENALLRLYSVYNCLIEKYPNPESNERWRTSVNLASVVCDNALNKVPKFAEMLLDIRHINSDKKEDILKYINQIDSEVNIEVLAEGESFFCDEKNVLVKDFIKRCEAVLGTKIEREYVPSSSDARFFSSKGVPCIIMNPKCGNLHMDDEWVDIASLRDLFKIYYGTVGTGSSVPLT